MHHFSLRPDLLPLLAQFSDVPFELRMSTATPQAQPPPSLLGNNTLHDCKPLSQALRAPAHLHLLRSPRHRRVQLRPLPAWPRPRPELERPPQLLPRVSQPLALYQLICLTRLPVQFLPLPRATRLHNLLPITWALRPLPGYIQTNVLLLLQCLQFVTIRAAPSPTQAAVAVVAVVGVEVVEAVAHHAHLFVPQSGGLEHLRGYVTHLPRALLP